jgi:hypothetical protein
MLFSLQQILDYVWVKFLADRCQNEVLGMFPFVCFCQHFTAECVNLRAKKIQ